MQILLNLLISVPKNMLKENTPENFSKRNINLLVQVLVVSVGDIIQTLYWITKWQQTAGCWAIHYTDS